MNRPPLSNPPRHHRTAILGTVAITLGLWLLLGWLHNPHARAHMAEDCRSRLAWARTWGDSLKAMATWNLHGTLIAQCSEVIAPPAGRP